MMKNPTDQEISNRLVDIISDGFNRSLAALAKAGAIDLKKMSKHYRGIGSKFYDVVTEQIEYTAQCAAPGVRRLFSEDDKSS